MYFLKLYRNTIIHAEAEGDEGALLCWWMCLHRFEMQQKQHPLRSRGACGRITLLHIKTQYLNNDTLMYGRSNAVETRMMRMKIDKYLLKVIFAVLKSCLLAVASAG